MRRTLLRSLSKAEHAANGRQPRSLAVAVTQNLHHPALTPISQTLLRGPSGSRRQAPQIECRSHGIAYPVGRNPVTCQLHDGAALLTQRCAGTPPDPRSPCGVFLRRMMPLKHRAAPCNRSATQKPCTISTDRRHLHSPDEPREPDKGAKAGSVENVGVPARAEFPPSPATGRCHR